MTNPETAVTAVVAARMKTLRTEARLSGAALAAAMKEQGVDWSQTTVAKLETGRRQSVSIDELLALAIVLEVSPVWLLVDPYAPTVPIAGDMVANPWSALMWMLGLERLGRDRSPWAEASRYLRQVSESARRSESDDRP